MLRTGVGLFFGTIVLVIVLPDTTPALLYAAMVAVGGGGAFWMMGRLGAREREEFAAGYTSRTAFVGLWQLGRGGAVLREPDRNVPPPGFYPSPYQPGLLQRWGGPRLAPVRPEVAAPAVQLAPLDRAPLPRRRAEPPGRRRVGTPALVRTQGPSRQPERKSVVEGKSVSGRVDLGGRRSIKKKKDHRR